MHQWLHYNFPTNNYLFKVINKNKRAWCNICPKLTIKTSERRQWRCSDVFIVNFEHISHHVLVYLLFLGATNYRWRYFFQVNSVLQVVNVRLSILFNIIRNQLSMKPTFKSCMTGACAFGWFFVILPGIGWFWAISDYFIIFTAYMIDFF